MADCPNAIVRVAPVSSVCQCGGLSDRMDGQVSYLEHEWCCTCAEKQLRVTGVISAVLLQVPTPVQMKTLAGESVCGLLRLVLFPSDGRVCVHSGVRMSETQVLSASFMVLLLLITNTCRTHPYTPTPLPP
ncbi:hypothetical protein AMECASPLE_008613 [Ameca splendens]|uniref:Uncharacterized protein n=1 Tax=Ameca splendens TaxID=208324 RepID=A0ABV0ZL24_9TELE